MSTQQPARVAPTTSPVGAAQAAAAGILGFAGFVGASIVFGAAVAGLFPTIPPAQLAQLRSLQAAAPAIALAAAAHVLAAVVLVAGPVVARRLVAAAALAAGAAAAVGAAAVMAGFDPIGRPGNPGSRLDGIGILGMAAIVYAVVAWLAARERRA